MLKLASAKACLFIRDDKSQYNLKIDAPVENEEELARVHVHHGRHV